MIRKVFVIVGLVLSLVVGLLGIVLTPLDSLNNLTHQGQAAKTMEQPGSAAKADQPASSPFTTAFAISEPRRAKAYEELTPGFWVGFDETKAVSIYIQQKADTAQIGGPDNKYLVDVDVKDAAGSDWITVERVVDEPGTSRLAIAFTARMSEPAKVDFVLFIPLKGQKPERITIGTANIGTDFKSFILEKAVDLQNFPNLETGYPSRIVALLPTKNGVALELARFEVFSL